MEMLGKRIRELREGKSIYQDDLARAIGVSKNSIYNYENGKRFPGADVLVALAGFFGCTTDYLLGLGEYKSPEDYTAHVRALERFEETLNVLQPHERSALVRLIEGFAAIERRGEKVKMELLLDMLNSLTAFIEHSTILL